VLIGAIRGLPRAFGISNSPLTLKRLETGPFPIPYFPGNVDAAGLVRGRNRPGCADHGRCPDGERARPKLAARKELQTLLGSMTCLWQANCNS
jgi:hypothetical protein